MAPTWAIYLLKGVFTYSYTDIGFPSTYSSIRIDYLELMGLGKWIFELSLNCSLNFTRFCASTLKSIWLISTFFRESLVIGISKNEENVDKILLIRNIISMSRSMFF